MVDHVLRPTRRSFLGLGAGLCGSALLRPLPGSAAELETLEGWAFGTSWSIVGPSGAGLDKIGQRIERLFDVIDRQMSPWRPDSTISRFNAAGAGALSVETELIEVTACALDLAELSGGAFDPTVGPLVARWGFGPITGGGAPDWRGLSVGSGSIGKDRGDLTLDLCGIAKGRALDLAAGIARDAGLDDLLLDLGGELKAIGRHPSGRSWHVAVQGTGHGAIPSAILRLPAGMSVATSGSGEQSYTLGGRGYGHIIDPAARAPARPELRSVTVLADDAMIADGWATALFAAGEIAGPELARTQGISALFTGGDASVSRLTVTGAMGAALL